MASAGRSAFRDMHSLERKYVNELAETISDREIIESEETRHYVDSMVKSMTGRYGGEISARLVYDVLNADCGGFTTNDYIYVNAASDLVSSFTSLSDRLLAAHGILFHEIAHCLFLDFNAYHTARESIEKGELYGGFPQPSDQEEKQELKEIKSVLRMKKYRSFFQTILNNFFNILTDAHDEHAMIQQYGGFVEQCILKVRDQLRLQAIPFETERSKVASGDKPQLAMVLNLLLVMARFGTVPALDPKEAGQDPLYQKVTGLKDMLEKAEANPESMALFPVVNKLMLVFWPYLRDELVNQATKQMMQQAAQQNGGQSGSQQGGGQSGSQQGGGQSGSQQGGGQSGSQQGGGQSGSQQGGGQSGSQQSGGQSGSQQGGGQSGPQQGGGQSGSQQSGGQSGSQQGGGQSGPQQGSGQAGSLQGGGQAGSGAQMSAKELSDLLRGLSDQQLEQLADQIAGQMSQYGSKAPTNDNAESGSRAQQAAAKERRGSGSNSGANQSSGANSAQNGTQQGADQSGNQQSGASGENQQGASQGTTDNSGDPNGAKNAEDQKNAKTVDGQGSTQENARGKAESQNQREGSSNHMSAEQAQEQMDGILKDLMRKAASRLAQREVEAAMTDDLIIIAKNASLNSTHKNKPKIIVRDLDNSSPGLYEKISKSQKSLLNSMVRQMERAFKDMSVGANKRHQVTGKKFRACDAHRLDGLCFQNTKARNNEPDVAMVLLVDKSGSMSTASRLTAAQRAGILVSDFCRKTDIPCMVCGHSIRDGRMVFEIYSDFRKLKDDPYRIAGGLSSVGGCNRDGMAIQMANALLEKRPEPVKLLMIISDGQPNDDRYCGDAACQDIKSIVARSARKGIKTLAFAIGDDKERIKGIYGEGFVDISDLSAFPKKLASIVRRYAIQAAS